MLTRILDCLEIPISNRRYTLIPQYINEVFNNQIGTTKFLSNWLNNPSTLPNIENLEKISRGIDLTNIYNFSLLCFHIERKGLPTNNTWFKPTLLEWIKSTDLNLDVTNLEFYKRFSTKDNKKVTRLRLLNAAYTTTRDLSKKAEVYNRVLEQGLISRISKEDFRFSSIDIRRFVKRLTQEDLDKYNKELNLNKLIVQSLIKL